MKRIILGSLLTYGTLFGEVVAPTILTDNDFEASEYQLFITNTKEIPLTKEMQQKVVYEGDIEGYYKYYNEMQTKKFKASEQLLQNTLNNHALGNALFFKDVKSLQNIGVATLGSVALNALLGGIMGDETYVQVSDYYVNGKAQTRIIKYIVSDDDLDKNERELLYKTSNDQSYHFRSGGFQSTYYK